MIGYARITPGRGFEIHRAVLYYLQRLVVWPRFRRAVCEALAASIRLRQGTCDADEADRAQETAAVAALERDGLAPLEPRLPREALETMVGFLRTRPVIGPDGRATPLEALPLGTRMAAYAMETVLDCPGLTALINDPLILRIASDYLGCKPTISSLGIRWSFPGADGQPESTQLFHRDPDDWRFLKFFLYLTDVDDGAGPHVYVAGSHRTAGSVRARPYERGGLERAYGADRIRTVTGPRGTSFMADTHGIHMGMPPARSPRLILQVQYSLLPIFAFRYRPLALACAQWLDPYVNRLLIR